MEASPWHTRESKLEEENTFQKLLSLHGLTDAWLQSVHPAEQKSHQIDRLSQFSFSPNLWMLEKNRIDGLPLVLHELVGAQSVADFLIEFSSTIWTIQLSYLESILSQTSDPVGLTNLLQKSSWAHGKKCAEKIWDGSKEFTLKNAYTAFIQFHWYQKNAFLLSRESSSELSFLWIHSPLQDSSLQFSSATKTLCLLHEEWMRGYFYGISRQIRLSSKLVTLQKKTFYEFSLLLTY